MQGNLTKCRRGQMEKEGHGRPPPTARPRLPRMTSPRGCGNLVLSSWKKLEVASAALKRSQEPPKTHEPYTGWIKYWFMTFFSIVWKLDLFTFSKLDFMTRKRFLGMNNGFTDTPGPSTTPKKTEKWFWMSPPKYVLNILLTISIKNWRCCCKNAYILS